VFDGLITVDKLILIAIFLGIGFPVHEAAHAYAAYRLGDSTARWMGRLTLNPVRHFDPIGGTLFVLSVLVGTGFIIGWAKPTPVNTANLRDRRNGEVIVALAGPGVNLILACVGAVVVRILIMTEVAVPPMVASILLGFVFYNIALMVFNLIPVPPLDGSTVLFRLLSPATAWRLRPMLAQYGIVAVLLIVFLFGQEIGNLMVHVTTFLVGG
jgi:Zn-dependent protease